MQASYWSELALQPCEYHQLDGGGRGRGKVSRRLPEKPVKTRNTPKLVVPFHCISGNDRVTWFGGLFEVRSAECGVWKMRSLENEECGKYGVWKMRSVENAECG